jgi:hypothetical protein
VSTKTFQITGRTVISNTSSGIHGLLISLSNQIGKRQTWGVTLASVLTQRDGSFTLSLQQLESSRLFKFKPTVHLQVFDRDKKLIYTSKKSYPVEYGKSVDIQIELSAESLANHLSRPITLAMKGGNLLPREKFGSIQRAIGLLAQRGTPEYAHLISISLCPLPTIDGFENLLEDAWGVLDENFVATRRFRDTLEVLGGVDEASRSTLQPQRDTLEELAKQLTQQSTDFSAVENLLGREAFIPVILAAGFSARMQPQQLNRYLQTTLDQISAYRPISALYTAAQMALSGGSKELAYFRTVLLGLNRWCGPDNFPFPPDPFPEIPDPSISNPEVLEHWGCTADAVQAIRFLREQVGFPPRPRPASGEYSIESVTPERACAGETITIRGTGFTSSPGLVRFSGYRGRLSTPIDIAPATWTDTEITVVSPEDARCGPLSLRIVEEVLTVNVCDAFVDLSTYRPAASTAIFMGCRPQIFSFNVNSGRSCVPRDTSATLSWSVHPVDAEVVISEGSGSTVRELYNGSGPSGSLALDTSTMGMQVLSITAVNPHADCAEVTRELSLEIGPPAAELTILGIEITQGIQRFTLDDPSADSNNSVALIAGMDTIVRVFVQSSRDGFGMDITRITGWLNLRHSEHLDSTRYAPINGTPPGSTPIIDAKPFPSRDQTDDSLNFRIPAGAAFGDRIISIEVVTAEPCEDYVSVSTSQPIRWLDRPAYPVTIRRIADPGTGDVVSEAEALRIINEAFDRLPSPRTNIRLRPGVFTIHPGTTEANYCRDGGFYQLALSVAYEHNGVEGLAPDPHESAWIGLFFQSGCTAGGMMSWPWTSTCISQLDPEVAAHELAHTTGMGHTRTSFGGACEDLFQPIACHDLPNNGQLTDVAFDIRNNRIISGAWDLMSYGPNRYPHPNHWEAIRERMDTRF